MSEVVDNVTELTPVRLTEILRRNGVLARGHVTNITLQSRKELFVSVVARLEVTYTTEADASAPRLLFFKTPSPQEPSRGSREEPPEEIVFYRRVATEMPDVPLARCFDAAYSTTSGRWHLLLEDLSETHSDAVDLPSFGECALAIDTLAQIHAHWWEHPRLGTDIGHFLTTTQVEKLACDAAANYQRFAQVIGERLSPEHERIYAQVIATFPLPWIRLSSAQGLTLTHGDAHVWNFLYPRAPGGRAVLVDWQLWHAHIGPRDLAYMMTLSWRPERRAEMEEKLVRRYHQSLMARGVRGYQWEQCWKDYRWSAIRNIFVPIWQWMQGMEPDFCWTRTLKALHAFEDLKCAELIEG